MNAFLISTIAAVVVIVCIVVVVIVQQSVSSKAAVPQPLQGPLPHKDTPKPLTQRTPADPSKTKKDTQTGSRVRPKKNVHSMTKTVGVEASKKASKDTQQKTSKKAIVPTKTETRHHDGQQNTDKSSAIIVLSSESASSISKVRRIMDVLLKYGHRRVIHMVRKHSREETDEANDECFAPLRTYHVEDNEFVFMPATKSAWRSSWGTTGRDTSNIHYPRGMEVHKVLVSSVKQVSLDARTIEYVGTLGKAHALTFDHLLCMEPLEYLARILSVKCPAAAKTSVLTVNPVHRYHIAIGFRRKGSAPSLPKADRLAIEMAGKAHPFHIHNVQINPKFHSAPSVRIPTRAKYIVGTETRRLFHPKRGQRATSTGHYWTVFLDVEGPATGNIIHGLVPLLLNAGVVQTNDAIVARTIQKSKAIPQTQNPFHKDCHAFRAMAAKSCVLHVDPSIPFAHVEDYIAKVRPSSSS